jgi:hypothetical protein
VKSRFLGNYPILALACGLMSRMKALIASFLLLMSGIGTAQDVHPKQKNNEDSECVAVLKVDSILYAGTKGEKVDSLTVCNDGKATAFHSFTEPAFGSAPPVATKWDYSREIDKDALSDLSKILHRTDIARLPERVDAIKNPSPIDVLMRFRVLDHGTERIIALHVPSIGCGEDQPEIPKGVWDLICADLYQRVKTGNPPPENSCGCKSLHKMALAQNPEPR